MPIVFQNNKWYTGQDLTEAQMRGTEVLTAEQRKKYPFVINPEGYYKVQNNRPFVKGDPFDEALYTICILSEKVAETKEDYNPAKHIGYFEDKKREAQQVVKKFNLKYEAMKAIMDTSEVDINAVVLMLNYTAKKETFNINPTTASPDEKKSAIALVIDENPQLVLNCFEKWNPNVKDDMFVMKLLHHRLIIKTGMDFYEATNGTKGTYIGSTIERVKDFLTGKQNIHLKDKFSRLIEQIETGRTVNMPIDIAEQKIDVQNSINMLKAQIKSNLYDKNIGVAKEQLDKFLTLTSPKDSDYLQLVELYNKEFAIANELSIEKLEKDVNNRVVKEIKLLKSDLESKTLEELLKLFKPVGLYKLDEISEIKKDREKIIDYMITKRSAFLFKEYMKNNNKA